MNTVEKIEFMKIAARTKITDIANEIVDRMMKYNNTTAIRIEYGLYSGANYDENEKRILLPQVANYLKNFGLDYSVIEDTKERKIYEFFVTIN